MGSSLQRRAIFTRASRAPRHWSTSFVFSARYVHILNSYITSLTLSLYPTLPHKQTMADGLQEWWNSLPMVTKYLFALSFGLTLAANFGLINPYLLVLDWKKVFYGFEVSFVLPLQPDLDSREIQILSLTANPITLLLLFRYGDWSHAFSTTENWDSLSLSTWSSCILFSILHRIGFHLRLICSNIPLTWLPPTL